jgi:MFS family permease
VASASSVAVVGALVGGLTTSSYWVLGPIVAETMQLGERQIGFFLAMAILGGALSQLPAGRLSDRIDRRWVMAGLTLLGVLSAVLALLSGGDANLLYPAMFLYGASTFPLYSLCLAHANDNTSLGLFEVGSVILLVHSTGAVFGPPIIAQVLQFSPYGLFMVSGTVLLVFGLWSASRAYFHPSRRQYFEPFTDTPKTSQEVLEVADATHEPDYAEAPTPADP